MALSARPPFFPDCSFAVLSWRHREVLEYTLRSYQAQEFADLFGQAIIFHQEILPDETKFAHDYGFASAGSPDNLGILGGFEAMAQACTQPFLLLVEHDALLVEPQDIACARMANALELLKSGQADICRMRHRQYPGQQFAIHKRQKYWPPGNAPRLAQHAAQLRRWLRPGKARRSAGWTPYYDIALAGKIAHTHPNWMTQTSNEDFVVDAGSLEWSNNTFLVSRALFLETIIPMARANWRGRGRYPKPTIEVELNGHDWRNSGLKIGLGPGLFEHYRVDHAQKFGPRQSPPFLERPL